MSDLSGTLDLSGAYSYLFTPTPPKPYIVSLDELLESRFVVTQKENEDKANITVFFNPEGDDLRPKLFEWANKGFPDIYLLQTISITPPVLCSDGVARSLTQYAEFLLGKTVTECLSTLQSKMPGLEVTMSHSANTLSLHVSRAPIA
jgi:hypothetical protein